MVATVSVNAPLAAASVSAPMATSTTPATLEAVLSQSEVCDIYELHYTGHAEANNLTIGGNDQPLANSSDEQICPTLDETTAFVDTGATIAAAGPYCQSAMSVGECDVTWVSRVIVTTGAGDDSIRVGPMSSGTTTVIYAGAGNDAIRALNGQRDQIYCGDGHDVVIADSFDQVASTCEVVQLAL